MLISQSSCYDRFLKLLPELEVLQRIKDIEKVIIYSSHASSRNNSY